MKRTISIILSFCLVLALLLSFIVINASAATSINYSFSGSNSSDPGYAQGTVTVTGSSGAKYFLYWGDDNGALSGYYPIKQITASGTTATYTFAQNIAIPKDAKYLLAFQGNSEPSNKSLANASAKFAIPNNKRIGDAESYSYAAFSDIHIDEQQNNPNYPYDEEHLRCAFDVAANRDVDFVVTSGDHINNARWDNNGTGYNMLWAYEYATYEKILSESNYCNPVYEAIGNHELWDGDTESNYKTDRAGHTQYNYFIKQTGLDSNTSTIASGKAYYEITEPNSGDHFIFLALEGGFYTDRVNEFSNDQLTWLDNKLTSYDNDGHNTYIIEHANFYKWGAGDLLDNPLYDIPLKTTCTATTNLENILKNHKNAIVITGHTHFQFSDVPNVSNNNNTSAYIVHNSSVGGVRAIENNKRVNKHNVEYLCYGYIVDVYGNASVFNATDLYQNLIVPEYAYIIGSANPVEDPTETTESTEPSTESKTKYGDADEDGEVAVLDALAIQKHLARLEFLSDQGIINSMVTNGKDLSITDATQIQRLLAGLIDHFPVEDLAQTGKEIKEVEIAEAGIIEDEIIETSDNLSDEVETYLTKQYIYASYDQYQACKKAVKAYKGGKTTSSDLTTKYNELKTIVNKYGAIGDTYDVYFTDNQSWGNVKAYAWGDNGAKNATWPGASMQYVDTNSMGQKIYKISLPRDTYKNIIFSNGNGTQTVDLKLLCTYHPQYYPTYSDNGKFQCGLTNYNLSLTGN